MRPGIAAFILATLLVLGAAEALVLGADFEAGRYLQGTAAIANPAVYGGLTLPRAALRDPRVLVVFGTSEQLYAGGLPYNAANAFAGSPTGFSVYTVSANGIGALIFLESLAALGDHLRDKKVVLFADQEYLSTPVGMPPVLYANKFSPEIADMFIFDSPISLDLREAGAGRLLAYPRTLDNYPLLRTAAASLADGSLARLAIYYAISPLGRIESAALRVKDASNTLKLIANHPEWPTDQSVKHSGLDWDAMLRDGSRLAAERGQSNPFGFWPAGYHAVLPTAEYLADFQRYCQGQSNREGTVLPPPAVWQQGMLASAGWRDLSLALRVANELGAEPLVITPPMPGLYYNYDQYSASVRASFYDKEQQVAASANAPVLTLRQFDEDRYFLSEPISHPSPRGWVLIDRALDLFWHSADIGSIDTTLDTLTAEQPSPGLPPPAQYCH